MKIKHKETGKVVELMDGSLYPKSAYDLVGEKSEIKATDAVKGDGEKKVRQVASKTAKAKKSASTKKVSANESKDADKVSTEAQPPVK